jgi:hypothetical protein
MPALSELNKANLVFALGASPLPISAVVTVMTFVWPEQETVAVLCLIASYLAAIGAVVMGSFLGGRRAPLLPARLGYLFGLAWIAIIVLLVAGFTVANGIIEGPAYK